MAAAPVSGVVDGVLDAVTISRAHGHENGIGIVRAKIGRVSSILAGMVHVGIPKAGGPLDQFTVDQGLVEGPGSRGGACHAQEEGQGGREFSHGVQVL